MAAVGGVSLPADNVVALVTEAAFDVSLINRIRRARTRGTADRASGTAAGSAGPSGTPHAATQHSRHRSAGGGTEDSALGRAAAYFLGRFVIARTIGLSVSHALRCIRIGLLPADGFEMIVGIEDRFFGRAGCQAGKHTDNNAPF